MAIRTVKAASLIPSGGNINAATTYEEGAAPGSADTIVFRSDGTSGKLIVNTALIIKDINFTNFTNTIEFIANLPIVGDLTRSSSVFTYTGTGGIILQGTTTQNITTSGSSWDIPITIGGTSPNLSLNDAFTINATLTLSSTTSPIISRFNVFDTTENIEAIGNIVISGNGIYTGSANILVLGSNNQTLTASGSHQIRNNLTIDKTGGVLSLSGTLNYNTGTLAYVASGGTVDASTSTLNIGASTTLNTNGITWNNVTTSGTTTLTLSSNFNITNLTINSGCNLSFSGTGLSISGNLTMGGAGNGASTFNVPNNLTITNFSTFLQAATNNYTLNGNTINITGNITVNMNNNNGVLGNTTLKMVGTGNLTFSNSSNTNFISNPFTIDTLGTITTVGSGTPLFSSSTITYTSGTITGVGIIFSACTLNLNAGGKWGTDVTIRGNTTLTSNATFGNLTTSTNNVGLTGAFTINVEGNLAINVATGGASTPIVLNGTGAQSWTHGSAVYLTSNLTINKASGTLTIGSLALPNVYYQTGTLTYNNIGGIVDTITNNSRLNSGASTTFATAGIIWNNATFSGNTPTFTLTNSFTLSGTLTLSGQVGTNTTISGADLNVGGLSVTTTSSIIGSSILNFTGTGTWNHTAAGYILKNININTSGTLTLGANIYYSVNTITYISGTVDSSTNSSNLNIFLTNTNNWLSVSLDTAGMSWYNIVLTSSGGSARTVTLTSDLSILNDFVLSNGGVGTTTTCNGNGSITCNALRPQPGSGNTHALNFNNNNIYTNDLLTDAFTAGTSTTMNNANLYISRNIRIGNSNLVAPFGGTVQIYYVGTGTWTTNQTVANQSISANFTVNTSGILTISRNVYFAGSNTFTYRSGKVNTKGSTLNITGNATLIGCNKINFDSVVITAGNTLTMNEFFCGTPELQTTISSTTTTNAIVTFTDNFEKIAKFVNINGLTFTKPQQLLLLTNQPKKTRNRGIRYNNDLPNGIPKGDPSVQNLQTVGQSRTLLLGDPAFVKSI